MDREALQGMSGEVLMAGIRDRHRTIVAAQAELLALINAVNTRRAWQDDGATSMATWLVANLKVDSRTANEWVRVAEALHELPCLASVLADGRASFDSVSVATKLAPPLGSRAWRSGQPLTPGWPARRRAPRPGS